MKTNIYCISLILISLHLISINSLAQEDTTCVVNGFVYEVEETNPLEDVTVRWFHYDTLGVLMNHDSIYTDAEGKFSVEIAKGIYSFYTVLENYRNYEYHENLELTDTLYNFDFVVYHPVISVSKDSLLIPINREDPVQRQIVVRNAGSGKLSYTCALYLREEIPEDLTQINVGGTCGEIPDVNYGPPADTDWKYLVRDRQDLDSGQHDLKSVMIQMIDGTFYLRVDFYDTIRSFSHFNFELWLDSDPAPNTGHPDAGFEYLIYINGEQGFLMAPLLDYANGNYIVLSDPVYSDIHEENNYIIVGYPREYLCEYEIILARAHTRAGMEDFTYTDYAPDWSAGNILFTVKSNPAVELNDFCGEADDVNSDTILLTIRPEIISDPLNNFFLGIVSEDYVTPITILPVQIHKPPSGVCNAKRSNLMGQLVIHPNPVVSNAVIQYGLVRTSDVNILIYNVQGKFIASLFKGTQTEGEYSVNWDGTDYSGKSVGSGIYYCVLFGDGTRIQKELILLK